MASVLPKVAWGLDTREITYLKRNVMATTPLPAGAFAEFLNFLMWNLFTATGWPWYLAR